MWEHLKQKVTLLPTPIRKQMDTEVIVIGEGLIGALSAYFFHTSHIPCILFDLPAPSIDAPFYLDEELTKLSLTVDRSLTHDLFHSVLDSIYTLDRLMTKLEKDRCQYERQPQLHYHRDHASHQEGYAIEQGLFIYQSGITFNPNDFKTELIDYLLEQSLSVYHEAIDTIELDGGVTIYTSDRIITARKLVVTSPLFYNQFFPILDNHQREDVSPSLLKSNPIRYFYDDDSLFPQQYVLRLSDDQVDTHLPLIGEDPLYPNVYFNVGHYHLLNGLIGSHVIQQLYLQSETDLADTIKFSTV